MNPYRLRGVRSDVPHFVYRCYDASGVLLYVGCTNSPKARVEAHRINSWWGGRLATVRYLVFADREAALRRERDAIYFERPVCNVKGRWYLNDPREDWSREDYATYRTAVVSAVDGTHGNFGVHTTKLLRAIDAEVNQRFGAGAA